MSSFFSEGQTLKFELENVPQVQYQLTALQGYYENPMAFTSMAREEAQHDMAIRFQTEVDPEGFKWWPLAAPAKDQVGILKQGQESHNRNAGGQDFLEHAAVSRASWSATPVGVFFDTSRLPDYWVFHEQPEGQSSQRITQRKFIGLSAEAEAQITATFEEWATAPTVAPVFAPTAGMMLGGVFRREGRGAGGRFISIQ